MSEFPTCKGFLQDRSACIALREVWPSKAAMAISEKTEVAGDASKGVTQRCDARCAALGRQDAPATHMRLGMRTTPMCPGSGPLLLARGRARPNKLLHNCVVYYATSLNGRFLASIARTNLSHLAMPARFSRM
jgi:hypothetical protein